MPLPPYFYAISIIALAAWSLEFRVWSHILVQQQGQRSVFDLERNEVPGVLLLCTAVLLPNYGGYFGWNLKLYKGKMLHT